MSKFEELIMVKKETKTPEKQKESKPLAKISIATDPSKVPRTIKPKTSQINEERIICIFNQVLDEKLQNLTQILENQPIPEPGQPSKENNRHDFTRSNLIWIIASFGERGTKLYELKLVFLETPAHKISDELDKLKNEGLLQSNRNGWKTLTNKGLELAESL